MEGIMDLCIKPFLHLRNKYNYFTHFANKMKGIDSTTTSDQRSQVMSLPLFDFMDNTSAYPSDGA